MCSAAPTATPRTPSSRTRELDDGHRHLLHAVRAVAERVPLRRIGLRLARAVGGAAAQDVAARRVHIPDQLEAAPRVRQRRAQQTGRAPVAIGAANGYL